MKFKVAAPVIVVALMPVTLTSKYTAFDSTVLKSTNRVPLPNEELLASSGPRTGERSYGALNIDKPVRVAFARKLRLGRDMELLHPSFAVGVSCVYCQLLAQLMEIASEPGPPVP